MGLFRSTPAEKAAAADLDAAQSALNANSARERKAGIRDETPEYERLNSAVNEAASNPDLPWYKR